jgi:5-methylcytosine-specific restriction endonuclease McrA
MPIRPENKKLYPKNWKSIREKILLRSKNKCEFCGVENYAIGYRDENGKFIELVELEKQNAALFDGKKLIKIVLTIAHLDHNPQNNKESNLKALCQKCHLNYDLEHHKETRKKNKKLPLLD